MFYKIDFSIAFSCKIYPKILDFRFSILYLCSVVLTTEYTESHGVFIFSNCHTEPPLCHPEPPLCHPERSEGSRGHQHGKKLRYVFRFFVAKAPLNDK